MQTQRSCLICNEIKVCLISSWEVMVVQLRQVMASHITPRNPNQTRQDSSNLLHVMLQKANDVCNDAMYCNVAPTNTKLSLAMLQFINSKPRSLNSSHTVHGSMSPKHGLIAAFHNCHKNRILCKSLNLLLHLVDRNRSFNWKITAQLLQYADDQ